MRVQENLDLDLFKDRPEFHADILISYGFGYVTSFEASADAEKGDGVGSFGPGVISTSGFRKGLLGLISPSEEVIASDSND